MMMAKKAAQPLPSNRRRAFTLTEILVVMVVIAILVGLLSAALGRAQELARTASCLSNLRQLSLASNSYAAHFRGAYPSDYANTAGSTGFWCDELVGYDSNMAANEICPDAYQSSAAGVGTATTAWGPLAAGSSSSSQSSALSYSTDSQTGAFSQASYSKGDNGNGNGNGDGNGNGNGNGNNGGNGGSGGNGGGSSGGGGGTGGGTGGTTPTSVGNLANEYPWLANIKASYGLNNWADPYSSGGAALASFNALDFRGNETFNGTVLSAVSITSKGGNTFNGNLISGGGISVNGGGQINGTQESNVPNVAPPNVQSIWTQIVNHYNPYPISGGNTIDFTGHPYLIINGSWSASGSVNVIGSGTLLVSGDITTHGQFSANMNIVTLGSITITGQFNLTGSIYCNGDFTNHGGHNIFGDVVVGGTYWSTGNGSITETTPPAFDPRSSTRTVSNQLPLFADSIWVDASPQDTDAVPASLQTGSSTLDPNDQLGRFCIDRHLGAVNVSFTDGSARTVRLAQLWQLQWSSNFFSTNVTVNAPW